MRLTDFPDDLLAVIAGHLPASDRKALSHASSVLRSASRLAAWWPADLGVHAGRDESLTSFAAWLSARSLGTRRLVVRVTAIAPHCAGFMVDMIASHMPQLEELEIVAEQTTGSLYLDIGYAPPPSCPPAPAPPGR